MSKKFWPKMMHLIYQNLIFTFSGSLGLKAFQSFYKALCMFAQMFFKRSDIKFQISNVKINFAPNIETIKIKLGFFPDNICTYLTIYSLKNIIDIYVQTPNMLAFFMLS